MGQLNWVAQHTHPEFISQVNGLNGAFEECHRNNKKEKERCPIFWKSRKSKMVAMSTFETDVDLFYSYLEGDCGGDIASKVQIRQQNNG